MLGLTILIIGAVVIIGRLISNKRNTGRFLLIGAHKAIRKEWGEIRWDPEWRPCDPALRNENGECTCLMHKEVCIPYDKTHNNPYQNSCLCKPVLDTSGYLFKLQQRMKYDRYWDWREH